MTDTETLARVRRDRHHYFVGPEIPPTVEIIPGQQVVVETVDCFSGVVANDSQRFEI